MTCRYFCYTRTQFTFISASLFHPKEDIQKYTTIHQTLTVHTVMFPLLIRAQGASAGRRGCTRTATQTGDETTITRTSHMQCPAPTGREKPICFTKSQGRSDCKQPCRGPRLRFDACNRHAAPQQSSQSLHSHGETRDTWVQYLAEAADEALYIARKSR